MHSCLVQRSPTHVVPRVDIRAGNEQHFCNFGMSIMSCRMQRGLTTMGCDRVDLGTGSQ